MAEHDACTPMPNVSVPTRRSQILHLGLELSTETQGRQLYSTALAITAKRCYFCCSQSLNLTLYSNKFPGVFGQSGLLPSYLILPLFFSFLSHVAMMKRTVDFTSKQINLGGLFKINSNLKIIIRYAENLRVPLYTLY